MNEKKVVIVVCLFLGIMLSLSLVSASAFSDFYDKLTGKATVVSGECTDSDGGINYYTPGKIVSSEGIKGGDYCSFGNLLVEQYCESSERINAYVYDCADEGKVCKDGACVVEETQCTDSDGGRDYYESGVARTYDGIHDYAIDSAGESCSGNSVIESYCINGDLQVKQEFYDCATEGKICQNGACVGDGVVETQCTDSDGGRDYYVKGTFSGLWNEAQITKTDSCLDALDESGDVVTSSNYLGEGYCENNQLKVERITCSSGCKDGACVGEGEEETQCTDSDGELNINDGDLDSDGKLNINDPDMDGDGIWNGDDPDANGDGILDHFINVIGSNPNGDIDSDGIANIDDKDMDSDGIPNGLDLAVNGDGVRDTFHSLIDHPNGDLDSDGELNINDPDRDGDGLFNDHDPDANGDGVMDYYNKGVCPGDCKDGVCVVEEIEESYEIEMITATDTSATIEGTNGFGEVESKEFFEGEEETSLLGVMGIGVIYADKTNSKISAKISVFKSLVNDSSFIINGYKVKLVSLTDNSSTIAVTDRNGKTQINRIEEENLEIISGLEIELVFTDHFMQVALIAIDLEFSSDLEGEIICSPSWSCKIQPAVCPSDGVQTRTCVDTTGCLVGENKEKIICSPGVCSGCELDEKCIPYGIRTSAKEKKVYCDIDGELKVQKSTNAQGAWAICQNNYECESNLCSSGECIEITQLIQETSRLKGLAVRFFCKVFNPFSDDGYNSCVAGFLKE